MLGRSVHVLWAAVPGTSVTPLMGRWMSSMVHTKPRWITIRAPFGHNGFDVACQHLVQRWRERGIQLPQQPGAEPWQVMRESMGFYLRPPACQLLHLLVSGTVCFTVELLLLSVLYFWTSKSLWQALKAAGWCRLLLRLFLLPACSEIMIWFIASLFRVDAAVVIFVILCCFYWS